MFSKSTSESTGTSPRFNILAVAPENTPFVEKVQELREANPVFELVVVAKIEDGLKLLRRGAIAAVLLYGHPQDPGTAELLIEGLTKERAPRFIIFFDNAPGGIPLGEAWVRIVRTGVEAGQLRRLLEQCCHEFEQRPSKANLTPLEVFESLAFCPDEVWIRVSHEAGESGDFCIRSGRALYCEVGRISGEGAASRLVSWTNCRFEFRDFPAFLIPNMDRRLDDLRSLRLNSPAFASPVTAPIPPKPPVEEPVAEPVSSQATSPPWQMPEPVPAAAPPEPDDSKMASDLEEPTEFPSLEQFAEQIESSQPVETKPPQPLGALEEPDDLPVFSFNDSFSDGELPDVEEPLQMLSMPDFLDKLDNEFEEPLSLPDFSEAVAASQAVPESLLFTSVAVISAGQLVSCQPADDAGIYDAGALADLYLHAARYALNHGLVSPEFLLLASQHTSILVGPIPGSDSYFAVRANTAVIGEVERGEIQRLKESLQITYSTVSA